MPDISQFTESKFLKRSDMGNGKLLTITECVQQNVAKESDPPEMKWCLFFEEEGKAMVLNKTNAELIAQFSGERNSDNWGGIKIVAYDDPSISFGGKLMGGIRVRAPKGSKPKPQAEQSQAPQDEDDIPF